MLTGGVVNSVLTGFGEIVFTMSGLLLPGCFVRHPDRPDWGLGQVQTVVGSRVTVNFENAGKRLINADAVMLEVVEDERESE
jgi:hypothetical protein